MIIVRQVSGSSDLTAGDNSDGTDGAAFIVELSEAQAREVEAVVDEWVKENTCPIDGFHRGDAIDLLDRLMPFASALITATASTPDKAG